MNDPRSQDESTEDSVREEDAVANSGDERAAGTGDAPPEESTGDTGPADAATTTESPAGPPGSRAAPRRRGALILASLALVVALAAAGGAGWLAWRGYQLEQQVARIPAERSEALSDLATRAQLGDLQQRLQSLARDSQSSSGQLQERLKHLEDAFQSVRDLAVRNQVGWRMAEVHYLLSVAQRRLAIAGDVDSAVAALEGADASLGALGDVRLLNLRKRIVADLTRLRASEPADVEGIALRVQNLLGRVGDLPLARISTSGAGGASGSGPATSWWQWLENELARFVVVHRAPTGAETGAQPRDRDALPPEDALRLALEDARSAALARDPQRYREAMDRATTVVNDRFATDAPATRRFLATLGDVAGRPVK